MSRSASSSAANARARAFAGMSLFAQDFLACFGDFHACLCHGLGNFAFNLAAVESFRQRRRLGR
jgi:hypothetical protein